MTEKQLSEGWQTVKFGEIARNISKRVEPSETDLGIYVGLEHLDPDSLKIKRHGVPSDVEGQKLLVKKGQIIFGKRRAYQRKVGVADWDCICSAHAMVLEAIPGKILPEFLPFFMQSDVFMNRAVAISEGSLSPTIKWKTLEQQRFIVPVIEKQSGFFKILRSMDSVFEKKVNLANSASILLKSLLIREIWDKQSVWKSFRIGDLGEVKLGRQRAPKYVTGKYTKPYLRVINVLDGELDLTNIEEMDFQGKDFDNCQLIDKDILITEGDIISIFNVGRSAIYNGEIKDCCFQNTLIRFRCGSLLMPDFALYLFRCAFYKGVFAYAANMTTVAHLGADRFSKIKVSIPSLDEQKRIVDEIIVVDKILKSLKKNVNIQDQFRNSMSLELMGID